MTTQSPLLYATAFLLFTAIASYSQVMGSGARAIPNETQGNFDSRPFDTNTEKLPANYHGVDVRALYEKLVARQAVMRKDEFETTEQYSKRLQQEETKPILGALTVDSTMAMEVTSLTASYNADEELMNISVTLEPLVTGRLFFGDFKGGAFVDKIKMDIPTAKRTKPNLRALAIFKLVKPYLVERTVTAKLLEVWVYDLATGQVFVKKKPEEALDLSKEALRQAIQYFNEGRDQEALAESRRVLMNEPMNAEAYMLIGRIHLRRGDQEQAISALKTAIFWDSKMIDAHILLGRIFLERNDRAIAMTYIRNALQIDPNNQDALELQRRIR